MQMTQLYLSFTSNWPNHLSSTKMAVELCVKDIGDWMLRDKLKLNPDKTELLVISSKYRPRPPLDYIRVGEEVIKSSERARNLGVGFDQYLDFEEHVKITKRTKTILDQESSWNICETLIGMQPFWC